MPGAGSNSEKTTYVPLFRGIEPYLWAYSAAAVKVYLWILIKARFKGDEKGTVSFSFHEIQDGDLDPSGQYLKGGVNLSPNTIRKALEELARGHLSNVPPGREAPPFIQILRRARGRNQKWKIEILKAKLSGLQILEGVKRAEKTLESKNQKTPSTPQPKNQDYRARDTLDEYIKKVSSGMDVSRVKT